MFLLPLPDFLWSQGQASFAKPQMVASKSYPYPSLPATSELALGWGRMWSGKLIMFPFPNLPCRVAERAREWQGLRVLRTELEEGTVLSRGIVEIQGRYLYIRYLPVILVVGVVGSGVCKGPVVGFGGWEGLNWAAVPSSICPSPLYKGQSACLSSPPLHSHIQKQPGWRQALGGKGWQGQGLQCSPHNWERFRATANLSWSCGSSLAQFPPPLFNY